MSLRLRLTLTYSLLMAVILAVFGVVLYSSMRQNLAAEMDRRLEVRASQVQLTIWPDTETLTPEDLTAAKLDLSPLADLDAPNLYVQVLSREGQIVAGSETLRGATLPVDPDVLASVTRGQRVFNDVELASASAIRILSVPIMQEQHIIGVLQVGQSRQPLHETMAGLLTSLQVLGVFALAISVVVGGIVAHRGLRTLTVISDRAAGIARQRDFSQRLNLATHRDEVGQLARTVDQLLETVDDTLRTHREFVADTSHELRNPLLAIRTNLELLDQVTTPADRAECVLEAREQVERMSRLLTDLLLLARVEAGQLIDQRPVALRTLVKHIAHEARHRASRQIIQLGRTDDVVISADEQRIGQILTNLVDNALRHTPAGGTVTLALKREAGWVRLSVSDTGEGIAPEHLPHVFERFYQANRADGRANGNAGLGLAIVKHLAEAHGGHVDAESELGHGSRFTVLLPERPQLAATRSSN